ncbi:MAG: DUF6491 family protein [Pseudomonadota bacterium]|jgi:hypothetical protein|nr:MAG: hypothetical protein DIU56_00250 [Pseudomonadota bacterium]
MRTARTAGAAFLATAAAFLLFDPSASRAADDLARERLALASYQIDDWSAPNDATLYITTKDGSRYRATFMGEQCYGLRFARAVSFVTHGLNQLDRFSGVKLPDGTQCMFRTFQRISGPDRDGKED